MCSCCLVSHILREPEAETNDAAGASKAAAAEQQKQHKNWVTTSGSWKALVQAGRKEVALDGAPDRVCTWKPPWNMKQRLIRQHECGHQDQSGVGFVDSAREKDKSRAVAEIYMNRG